MFGHQDEPKNEPVDNTADQSVDNTAQDDTATSFSGTVSPAITPLVGEHNEDGRPSSPNVALPTPGSATDDSITSTDADTLLDIKQQALQHLTPLVGHLEQSPEEKFRTTMMMIQASDNQSLIKNAYDAAQAITDEKARAQALLDIVNEINYFTQHQAK